MSGHGWTLLVLRLRLENKLTNNLVQSEHHVGLFANVHVMAAFDAWEHAYFFDYQTAKAKYVESILSGLDWNVVGARLSAAGY
jgi:Fe-Mn family superoxide dismutase